MSNEEWGAIVAAPGFALGLCVTETVVSRIEFLHPQRARTPRTALAAEAVRQIAIYLQDPSFVFELPMAAPASAHGARVRAALMAIPPGTVLTYGEVARRIGSSPRAVGGACGANALPVVVPCHRIIAAGGALGGFAHSTSGFLPGIKRWLLAHECAGREFRLTANDPVRS